MSFSAPSHGAGYFPFGESNQSHSRWTRWSRRRRVGSTALAPCLARAGANSHIPVLKQSRLSRALGFVAAASRQRWNAHSDTAIHGLDLGTGRAFHLREIPINRTILVPI